MSTWRLVLEPPLAGPVNMARDQYALGQALKTGTPIVRLYSWEGLVLSVGRNQKVGRQLNLAACRSRGVPLVRRMTGGRAVLHGTDLTYSVAAPTAGGRFSPGIMAIYKELSGVFVNFFEALGFQPQVKAYSGGERAGQASAICFSTPSAFEILLDGRKIVGSAQRLLPNAFLQHGSLPLQPQDGLLELLFQGVSAAEVRAQMTDLETLGVWKRYSRAEMVDELVRTFEQTLGIKLEPRPWSGREEAAARALEADFAYLEWE